MDKIKNSFRSGCIDIKEVCKKWEEELFSLLIADKDSYLPGKPLEFQEEAHADVRFISAKVYALYDLGVIDKVECDTLVNQFYGVQGEYVKSKVKEVS